MNKLSEPDSEGVLWKLGLVGHDEKKKSPLSYTERAHRIHDALVESAYRYASKKNGD